jgi:hypothetical protein
VLRKDSGQTVTVTLEALVADPKSPYVDPMRGLAPQRMASETAPWRSAHRTNRPAAGAARTGCERVRPEAR